MRDSKCSQTNCPAVKYRGWKFIHAPSYTGVIRSVCRRDKHEDRSCRHLEHVVRAMRDDSFQFSRPRKVRIPTRQFLAEIGASWRGASWETGRPRVKSRASLRIIRFSRTPPLARAFISAVLTRSASSWIANYLYAA